MEKKKIAIVGSGSQVKVIMQALELYARLGTGQMQSIDSVPFLGFKDTPYDFNDKEKAFEELRQVYFPELVKNQSYGIRSEKTPEECKVAWDIQTVLRNKLAWDENPEGGSGVYFQEPYAVSEEPLPEVKIEKE